ncbi:MAG: RnfH family protein [Dokdonella sp.]
MIEDEPHANIAVEVAYAEPGRQFLRLIQLPAGARVADAIAASGVAAHCAIDVDTLVAGVWSKVVQRDTQLRDGDRVELYRVLKVDPKDSRRRRAERVSGKRRGTRQP